MLPVPRVIYLNSSAKWDATDYITNTVFVSNTIWPVASHLAELLYAMLFILHLLAHLVC